MNNAQQDTTAYYLANREGRTVASVEGKSGEYSDEGSLKGYAVIVTFSDGLAVTIGRYGAVLAEEQTNSDDTAYSARARAENRPMNSDEQRADRAERIARAELPADWDVWHDERCGWAVSRDHGSLVVGVGYISRAQAMDVARRTLAADAA